MISASGGTRTRNDLVFETSALPFRHAGYRVTGGIRTLTTQILSLMPLPSWATVTFTRTDGGIRTRTERALNTLPLPVGLRRLTAYRGRDSNPHWMASQTTAATKLGYHGVLAAGFEPATCEV